MAARRATVSAGVTSAFGRVGALSDVSGEIVVGNRDGASWEPDHTGGGCVVRENDSPAAPAGQPDQANDASGGRAGGRDTAPARPDGLSARDARILEFEARWWRTPGAKDQAIRDAFGLSSTRYYQLLNRMLDSPAALAADPVLLGRLRRLREGRRGSRGGALETAHAPGPAFAGAAEPASAAATGRG
jgi:hypothetical protein